MGKKEEQRKETKKGKERNVNLGMEKNLSRRGKRTAELAVTKFRS